MKKKPGRPKATDSKVEERRAYIGNYLNNYGFFNIPKEIKEELAEQYNVSVNQVEKDIRYILSKVVVPAVADLAKKFTTTFNKAMRESTRLMNSEDPAMKAKGIDLSTKTAAGFTKFMEDYGHKEKVADRLDIESGKELKKINENLSKLKGLNPEQQKIVRETFHDNLQTP